MLVLIAVLLNLLLVSKTSAAPSAAVVGDCTVTIRVDPLTAKGLATPMHVTGNGCTQKDMATFAQGAIFDPATKTISVYNPLVLDKGTKPLVHPTKPTLPANAVVAIWFGSNANSITLAGNGAKNCVNGVAGSVFGQFAHCNADNFFAAVNAANITIPGLGTALDGLPCPSIRDFVVVDMDQSDNVITSYWLLPNGTVVQDTDANRALFPNGTESDNGSDNRLLTNFMAPAFGCMPWQAPDLANNNKMSFALPLNELQAAAYQTNPAVVPAGDPMVLNNGNEDLNKLNLYRTGVNQPAAACLSEASTTTYCQNIVSIGLPRLLLNQDRLTNFKSPVPDAGNNLWTFLAQRSNATLSAGGLNCLSILNMANPWSLTTDGNGVTTAATLTLPGSLAESNGGSGGQATANGGNSNLAALAEKVVSALETAGNSELAASKSLLTFVSALNTNGNSPNNPAMIVSDCAL